MQGGTDTQSLKTILEFRDLDLLGNSVGEGHTDTVTSRLDIRNYNNSSSLSNFVLPQTTYRTNRTGDGTNGTHRLHASAIPHEARNLSSM